MRFMQIESVLQTINRSEPAKNRFSVALPVTLKKPIKNSSHRSPNDRAMQIWSKSTDWVIR